MTATLRPQLIKTTLKSFSKNVIRDIPIREFRLILNVDPIGEDVKQKVIYKIARKFIPNIVVIYPETPCFSRAVMNVWKQVESDFVFHLEEDWIFNRKVNLNNMISILNNNKKLSSLRLLKLDNPNDKRVFFFRSLWDYQPEGYYISHPDSWKKCFGLNPILIRKKFIQEALPLMVEELNPEKQFRYSNYRMRYFLQKWQYGIYAKPGETATISDIGRTWMKQNKFKKPEDIFLTWVKEN
jgi:hypothetical protein